MATIESKLFQLLLAMSTATDAYKAVVRSYTLHPGTSSAKVFEVPRCSLTLEELILSPDSHPYFRPEIEEGLAHLVRTQKIELIVVGDHLEYTYKRI